MDPAPELAAADLTGLVWEDLTTSDLGSWTDEQPVAEARPGPGSRESRDT